MAHTLLDGWRERAACLGMSTDAFFADDRLMEALAVCRDCPVRAPCLRAALNPARPELHGVWGGTRPDERRDLLRRGAA